MDTYVGLDLGTSGIKALLADGDGNILAEASAEYAVSRPAEGWSEQNPEDWMAGLRSALKALLRGQDAKAVRAMSFGGQMHGLVALDGGGKVIRPCILWNDGRTERETAYLNETVGREKLTAWTANIAFAGFTAPKLLWLREHEPEAFERIAKILLPKDYLVYRLTGKTATDYSDASGTLLLNVGKKRWSAEMCEACGVKKAWLPELHESYDTVGKILPEIAEEFGLSAEVKIAAGAGDNAAAAVGTGTVTDGSCTVSLGTSGTIFIAGDAFAADCGNALHSFCHANGKWHMMGCILSAASANKWWLEEILGSSDYAKQGCEIAESGAENGIYFLPYLTGERSPHNDVHARGAFVGLSATATRGEMSRAVMEGVAFALRDCLEAARRGGAKVRSAKLCGGGARSGIWRQIVAEVLDLPIELPQTEQGPAYGAAMLAMVADGAYPSVEAAAKSIVRSSGTILPDRENAAVYGRKYKVFQRLYPALKGAFTDC